jgi:hypothetical protein
MVRTMRGVELGARRRMAADMDWFVSAVALVSLMMRGLVVSFIGSAKKIGNQA